MSRALFAVVLAFPLIALANPHYRPDVEVNVPPEVFSSGGQSAQPCTQCCVYQDQNYSEGAVIKAEGILLQCQRDDKTLSTNPLVWRLVVVCVYRHGQQFSRLCCTGSKTSD